VIVCIVWGTTYLGIRISLETIPPFLMAAVRWLIAGAILTVALKLRGERLPRPAAWPSLFILGILLLGFGNGGVVWAEQTVPSGLAAVLVATCPFWMVGIDVLMSGGQRLAVTRLVGLIVGFGGIVLLVWPEIRVGPSGREFLHGVFATQIACAGWAAGSVYARKRGHAEAKEENVLATAAFEMLFGGAVLLMVGLVRHETARFVLTPRTGGALLYLIFVGAIGGFTAYAYALKHLPVATVSLYAYINPIIAVILGTLILKEPFSVRMAASAAIVLAGMALVRTESEPEGAKS
jgi:drug/metabolite transporter (DMT)-like permease